VDNILIAVVVLMSIAIVVHAYNMGWQAGHDIHHDDSEHGSMQPPATPPSIWR